MMSRTHNPLIPQTIGEINDKLAWMLFYAPKFRENEYQLGDIEMVSFELKEGFGVVRAKLGEERYAALMGMSDKARALFKADPEEKTGQTTEGQQLLIQMEKVLRARKGG